MPILPNDYRRENAWLKKKAEEKALMEWLEGPEPDDPKERDEWWDLRDEYGIEDEEAKFREEEEKN